MRDARSRPAGGSTANFITSCRSPIRVLALWSLVGTFGITSAGCSFSYKLDSLFARDKAGTPDDYSELTTAGIDQMSEKVSEADLVLAKAAASEAVKRSGRDVSIPWENPATGARGMVTALATAYTQNGTTCRDFLASYVRDASETWLAGEACRSTGREWQVRNLRPWRRSPQ